VKLAVKSLIVHIKVVVGFVVVLVALVVIVSLAIGRLVANDVGQTESALVVVLVLVGPILALRITV